MTQQMSIDDIEPIVTENGLTTRQWKLHELYKNNSGTELTRIEILKKLDYYYGYSKEIHDYPNRETNNLSCMRELGEDIEKVKWNDTIKYVYVGGKYANSQKEARIHLIKKHINALKELKYISLCNAKLENDGQMRLRFNKEKDHIDSILREEEKNLENLL